MSKKLRILVFVFCIFIIVCEVLTDCYINGNELSVHGCYPAGCPVPICLSAETRIKTPTIEKVVTDLKESDFVISDNGKLVKIKKTSKTEAKKHKILKITFHDATTLEISPNHPTSDRKLFKELKIGDLIGGKQIIEIKEILYKYKYTYDILPDSETGNYYANGVLIGSTLKR